MIDLIEKELGRALDKAQLHSVATLNDISPAMLGELRRLSPRCVNTYLKYHLRAGSEHVFEDFTRDVIHDDLDPKTWGFRDVLALMREKGHGEVLIMPADQLRDLFVGVEGERWVHFSVEDARQVNRSASDSAWGAPGVLVRQV